MCMGFGHQSQITKSLKIKNVSTKYHVTKTVQTSYTMPLQSVLGPLTSCARETWLKRFGENHIILHFHVAMIQGTYNIHQHAIVLVLLGD